MQEVIRQRLAQCKHQLEQAYAAHAQAEQQVVTLRTEIVGLQRTIQELEALTQQQVSVALPAEARVDMLPGLKAGDSGTA